MNEVMYEFSSLLIAGLLFLVLIIAAEAGYRLGRSSSSATREATKSQINTLQASLLGVLGLLLGFTFAQSLARYESRSEAVIAEANAIGTAALRAGLLPESVRALVQERFREYIDLRVEAGHIPLNEPAARAAVVQDSNRILDELWTLAVQAAQEAPNPVTTGLYIQSLNEVIDTYEARDAALNRHVPEAVLFLLFGTFALTAGFVGYASGITGQRAMSPAYILMLLIVLLVYIVIDLDRPRRGLIAVSQQSMINLQSSSVATPTVAGEQSP